MPRVASASASGGGLPSGRSRLISALTTAPSTPRDFRITAAGLGRPTTIAASRCSLRMESAALPRACSCAATTTRRASLLKRSNISPLPSEPEPAVLLVHCLPADPQHLGDLLPGPPLRPRVGDLELFQ